MVESFQQDRVPGRAERGSYFAHEPACLEQIRSWVEDPLWQEYGFTLSDRPLGPDQLEFYVPYGRHTQMSGPVLWVTIGIVGEGWNEAGKIDVHIYGMGRDMQLFSDYLDSPEQVLPAIRVKLEREGLVDKIRQGMWQV